jgi:hypothetical protein
VIFIIPKVGAISDLAIKIPTTDTEERYFRSLNRTLDAFREILHNMARDPEKPGATAGVDISDIGLPNLDLDTGRRLKRGDYPLADKTYGQWLARLSSRPDRVIPMGLKKHILDFYASGTGAESSQSLQEQLAVMKRMKVQEDK